ncbi:oligosaccharide flippase family protein [Enterobacter hormaechei]|uniref:lipopolysaccharide biosynthesis protein n=1 Tax=Enterobacter hormaechei TaxID=158836 RepID=UPI0007B3F0B6|nr:oligosaccharide flippase family protein [Enterobacter hormaechei]ELE6473957.1 oligosaccharide flippase family protein [Enterobacter hormaechei]KZR06531.1 polysaccharide biosynthesis protein [Enterobacter hormaechei subsp. steigerwaltii]MCO7358022.1 oligosaccharide flippase family protein [Enterobacter hormaechei]HAV1785301.1 oligosaccharide flippase family protein [Enterobacter hormaechei subsp. steigerwaltii]HAV1798752.1 oligosaccharide flippase family protein [Enterobacter hormaechei subs
MSLVRNSTIYLSSNILNALVPFLLLPILTHNLNPGDYGQIAMFQTLVSGLAALTGLNTIGAANRRYYDDQTQAELSTYNGACIHILLLSSIILFLIVTLFSTKLSELLNIPSNWIYLSIIVSAGTFIIQLRLAQWQIRERAWYYGLLQVSQSVFIFVLTLVLLFLVKQGAVSRINALLFGTIVYVLISLFTLFKERLLILTIINTNYIKDALKFGIPLVPHIVGIFFLSAIDRILISGKLGIEEAGVYMLGVQLSLGMVVVFDAINKALIPWLFRILSVNDLVKLKKLVRFSYFYFVLLAFLGILSFWIGPLVVNLFAGPQYQQAISVIGWLCLGQAFNGMYLMVTNYLFYAKKTGRLSIITISCGIFNIVLLLIMMKTNGIIGVAMAFSISMCIRFLATWALVWQLKIVSWNI